MRKIGIIFALLLALPLSSGKAAASVVENPAAASEGMKTAVLTEQWRTGGEDSDVIFGNLGAAEDEAANEGDPLEAVCYEMKLQ